jgi:hypothetical protein
VKSLKFCLKRRAGGEVAEGYAPYMGMVGGSVLGWEGRRVAEGLALYLEVGYCREGGLLGEKYF